MYRLVQVTQDVQEAATALAEVRWYRARPRNKQSCLRARSDGSVAEDDHTGEDQQQRRKSGWLEKSRSTWAPVLGGEEEQPPAVRQDVRLYGEEAQAEGRAQEKQRMAANSRKASKTAAGTVAYDDGSAGLGIRDAGIKTGS
ncbi:hypothetical protein WOLCODRAFT_157701 [Wolfiporia cocos MD-104 SS10]|uniref:Uncharacterized protein n=1 Tax=Wolfiporia cocos (strain MD-104) TaxID=742152 RepID=A0A2H3J427_WOLCO|nr:hypothetical protein WOLCODRAFT_157701 [Wolfiporia cocos MD-104 SS10]